MCVEDKMLKEKEICSKVDHTLLKQTATWEDIKKICDEAIEYGAASVCIPPCYVGIAKNYVANKMKICNWFSKWKQHN